jgi:hypothetical protein
VLTFTAGFWIALVLIGVYGFEKRLGAGTTGGEVTVYLRGKAPEEVTEAMKTGQNVDDLEAQRAENEKDGAAGADEEAEKKRQEEVDKEAEKHLVKHEAIFSWHRASSILLPLKAF